MENKRKIVTEQISVKDVIMEDLHTMPYKLLIGTKIYVSIKGNGDYEDFVPFTVQHRESHDKQIDVYFVADKTIGNELFENIERFLSEYEKKMPSELLKQCKTIIHRTPVHENARKLSLLSLANIGMDKNSICLGEDDIPFVGFSCNSDYCVAEFNNSNKENVEWFIDTEFSFWDYIWVNDWDFQEMEEGDYEDEDEVNLQRGKDRLSVSKKMYVFMNKKGEVDDHYLFHKEPCAIRPMFCITCEL